MAQNRNRTPERQRRRPGGRPGGFHGGSFTAGIVLGVALTLTGALLPDLFDGPPAPEVPTASTSSTVEAPKFEFFESLPKNRVDVDTAPYETLTPGRPREPVEYLLQAGSFGSHDDAERLRASVLLLGLEARTTAVVLADGAQRHRVIVGPFSDDRDMRRALSKLREQDIDPLLLARKPGAG